MKKVIILLVGFLVSTGLYAQKETIKNDLEVGNDATVKRNLTVDSTTSILNLTVDSTAIIKALTVENIVGNLTIGGSSEVGDSLVLLDPTNLDTVRIFDDGDTTRIESTNPIKIGNNSLTLNGNTTIADTLRAGTILTSYENTITVAKSGGDFTTVKEALASITDNSITNRYAILVSAGLYVEDNPLVGKEYVIIKADGGNNVVRLQGQNPNQDLITGSPFFYVEGVSLFGVSGVNNYAVNMSSEGEMVIKDVVVENCSNGILLDNALGYINMLNSSLYTFGTVDMNKGIHIKAGNATVDFLKVIRHSDIDTIINAGGENSILTLNNIISFSDSVTIGLYFHDKVKVTGYGSRMKNMYDGLILEGDSVDVRLDVTQLINAQNDGFRIEPTGLNPRISLFSTSIDGSGRYNFNIENPTALALGNGFTELDKSKIVEGVKIYVYLLDLKPGDEGLNVLGELRVGRPEVPTESTFGGGDSYNRNTLVYAFDGTSTYTDYTDSILTVDNFSVEFPNTSPNAAIYIASTVLDSAKHYGIKVDIENPVTIGSGEIVAEYWNGSGWSEFNCMVSDAGDPYLPYAKNYFEQNGSNQIRYNPRMVNNNWVANDPISLGSNHKWVRFRIETAITSSPRIDQIKLHTERTEINEDGFIEFFGNARPVNSLSLSAPRPLEGNMQSTSIYVDQNVGAGLTNNTFTAVADITGFSIRLPYNIDTSAPIDVVWAGRYVTGGTAQWTIRMNVVKPEDTYYTAEPAASGNTKTVVLNETVTSSIRETFRVSLDISEAIAHRDSDFGDEVWITIQPTTLPGNFAITNVGASYTSWCAGGHQE